jgi:integral membrane protein (TIGR01906 family)
MGLALAFVVLSLALQPVLTPQVVRELVSRYSSSTDAGLSQERLFFVAEQVRAFSIDGSLETLPETVDGRSGFDSAMVSHLRDVRMLIMQVRFLAGIVAIVVALWMAVQIVRGRPRLIAFSFTFAAIVAVALVAGAAGASFGGFDAFFRAFHGVFFPGGNWSFPTDSLLIETFPETFWAAAAVVWGGLVVVASAVLLGAASVLRRQPSAP